MTIILTRALLPIFVLLGLGIYAGVSRRLDNRNVASLNIFLMDFALPASMFAAIAKTDRANLIAQAPILLVLSLSLLAFWLATYALWRWVFHQSSAASAVAAISISLPNFAAAGLPLLTQLQGNTGTVRASMAIAVGAVILSPLTLIVLDLSRKEQSQTASASAAISAAALRVAKAPLVFVPLLATVLVLLNIQLPEIIIHLFALLGAAAAGAALLLTGLVVSAYRPAITLPVLIGVVTANMLHPVFTDQLCRAFMLSPNKYIASVLLTALPSGFFGIFFALRYGQDVKESSAIVSISTAFSLITLTVAVIKMSAFS